MISSSIPQNVQWCFCPHQQPRGRSDPTRLVPVEHAWRGEVLPHTPAKFLYERCDDPVGFARQHVVEVTKAAQHFLAHRGLRLRTSGDD
jgi:hypothetical protein